MGALVALALGLSVAWLLAQAALSGSSYLLVPLLVVGASFVLIQTLKNWRTGIFLFLTWMLFEDLVRKYLGNNMVIYFAKDVLALACCIGFYVQRRKERRLTFQEPYLLPLVCFVFWAAIEVFNPNSPSIWYGLLGLQVYFGFMPLFLLGYALIRDEEDLRRFLLFNLVIAAMIALLGVSQGVTGQTLLSPAELAPDIRELGNLTRAAPITGQQFLRPPSVFVSDGRFGGYLLLAWLLGFGACIYSFLRRLPERKWTVVSIAIISAAIVVSAVRSSLMWVLISAIVLAREYGRELWKGRGPTHRIVMAGLITAAVGGLVLAFLITFYPDALDSRIAFYQQTLLPSSPTFELRNRIWDYPVGEFLRIFDFPHWLWGYGTGVSSLGTQYIVRYFGVPPAGVGVESGFGNLILEMGIPGLLLWLAWTGSLLSAQWRTIRQLRGGPLFPIGFVIFWFSLISLFFGMVAGIAIENYITAAYLFLLSGILFSLPRLAKPETAQAYRLPSRRLAPRPAPAFRGSATPLPVPVKFR